jgi:beta-xylosidase
MLSKVISCFFVILMVIVNTAGISGYAQETDENARNPIIWADVPDPSVLRVGDTYYMSSTTMHMNPGIPIMRSEDLVNWEIVNYAYDILEDTDRLALRNGQDAYGQGSWASSLRYHEGTYYLVTFSYTTNRTHIYATDDIENGAWDAHTLPSAYHDPALYFEDDGGVYLVYGSNNINIIELTSDLTAVQPGGLNQTIIPNAGQIAGSEFWVPGEGAHIHKIDSLYYIFIITWPAGGMRTQLVYRSENLAGPYEGVIALQHAGIAQGGLIDTPDGDWYAMLFQDHGAVGRIPYLIPVAWEDGWPVLGVNGQAPQELDIPAGAGGIDGIVASDEFERTAGEESWLPLQWQWNHNPIDEYWSLAERPGYLRLINDRIDESMVATRNTLTQRTFGPECSAVIAMDISNMNDGDYAGLGALQQNYGFIGVKATDTTSSIVMVYASSGTPVEVASVPVLQDRVYLRIDMNYRNRLDRASFYYSLDGVEWTRLGNFLQMSYTLPHFMGYRYALFNFATKSAGGYVDIDYFRVAGAIDDIPTSVSDNERTDGDVPDEFRLLNNYPNPFNPGTVIEYHVPEQTEVRIQVFDAIGRLVDTLVHDVQGPGFYSVQFNASRLPSGVYYYRMQAGSFSSTQKMILIR